MMNRLILDEPHVYRHVALPVSAFNVLQQFKRAWRLETNAEVLTRLLRDPGRALLAKSLAKSAADANAPSH